MPAVSRPERCFHQGAAPGTDRADTCERLPTRIDCVAPPASGESACRISSALWNRAAGSFSRHRRMTSATAAGVSLLTARGSGGLLCTRCSSSWIAESPWNGTVPVTIS